MLDYSSLAAVAAVIREGNFEKAAAVLGVTPSAVSQRVRALEERLGVILVIRSQPCAPTEIGARLCAHVDRVRLLESDIVANLPDLAKETGAENLSIRIAVNRDSLSTWFPAAAERFASHSEALLDIVLDSEEHTAERLRNGEVVAAVTADPVPVQGCSTASLGVLRYVATASPMFARRFFADGVDLQRLKRAPMVQVDRHDGLQTRWMREAFGDVVAAPTHWVPATHGCLDIVLGGLGWGMTPMMLAKMHLAEGRLVEMAPYHQVEVKLFWQYYRVSAKVLEQLTKSVAIISKACLR